MTKKNSTEIKEAMIELLKDEPLECMTPDRGKEFSKHFEISKELNLVEFYFPFPHHHGKKEVQMRMQMDY